MNEQDRFDTTYMIITLSEAKAIYRVLEHQYINYEDEEAVNAVRRIAKFAREGEGESDGNSRTDERLADQH